MSEEWSRTCLTDRNSAVSKHLDYDDDDVLDCTCTNPPITTEYFPALSHDFFFFCTGTVNILKLYLFLSLQAELQLWPDRHTPPLPILKLHC